MENTSRRDFLKRAGLVSAATIASTMPANSSSSNILSEDRMGVLVDTTHCIGCRSCEWGCRTSHNIQSESLESFHDRKVFKEFRRPSNDSYTVINEFSNQNNDLLPINVKYQCMHCDKPACVSACIVGAITKDEKGAVTWDGDKCIGCRYCMVACPFQVPTFDYQKAIQPEIHKCDFCKQRTQEGNIPACVEICPVEALVYGQRSELIKIARKRIQRHPEKYKNHIYGELEVGGTSWLYLAGVSFTKLRLPKHNQETAPGVSESIQHGIFAYFVPPLALYAWLGGMMWVTKRKNKQLAEKSETDTKNKETKEEDK